MSGEDDENTRQLSVMYNFIKMSDENNLLDYIYKNMVWDTNTDTETDTETDNKVRTYTYTPTGDSGDEPPERFMRYYEELRKLGYVKSTPNQVIVTNHIDSMDIPEHKDHLPTADTCTIFIGWGVGMTIYTISDIPIKARCVMMSRGYTLEELACEVVPAWRYLDLLKRTRVSITFRTIHLPKEGVKKGKRVSDTHTRSEKRVKQS